MDSRLKISGMTEGVDASLNFRNDEREACSAKNKKIQDRIKRQELLREREKKRRPSVTNSL